MADTTERGMGRIGHEQWLLPVPESWNEAKKQNQIWQDLEEELDRFERIHAEKVWILRSISETAASPNEYNRNRIAEVVARRDVEVARAELEQHKRSHAKAERK